ncbi:MAG: hypothetical protein NTW17_03455 [Candidatus Pacearchaeota archaeon]|nr:hypothetical protein [Candidatus Pacearchaeota archaeon]
MVNKESYTRKEVAEIIDHYVLFSDSVRRLGALYHGGSLMVRDIFEAYNDALHARNVLMTLDAASDYPNFRQIDERFGEVAQLETKLAKDKK